VGGRAAAGIATQTFGGGKGRIDLDAIPDLSTTRGGTQVRLRATPPFAGLRASSFLAPFGAALGNPEMAGRQTVRARTKNASFPNLKLLVSSAGFQDGHQSGARGKRPWYYDEQ